ncbi:hypothetical protein BY458DRAFT_429071 [Sporodiniella umbellata]|nr:hypothetical protein BY458DRAFT_429071 [Sporodiniella umbellata]
MLRVLSACLHHQWKYHQAMQKNAPKRPALQRTDTSFLETLEGVPPIHIDPPPLDDTFAKYLISLMFRFLSLFGATIEDREQGASMLRNATSPTSVYEEICETAGRIITYASASNWDVVFSKFKGRLLQLKSAGEEVTEIADLAALENVSLNSKRLSMVLTELCTSMLNLKKSIQQLVAITLRKAIWNWIENYTAEFMFLCHNQKRMDGTPELLFDIFNSLADTAKKKAIYWPVQTMLLVLCPDIMLSTSMIGGNGHSKKAAFLSSLQKAMKAERMAELAAICYVDICRAATYVSKNDMTAIRQIVPDIETELIDKLFDSNRTGVTEQRANSLGVYVDYQGLMSSCIVALFRLDPEKTVNRLIPSCFEFTAPVMFKTGVLKAAVIIVSEQNRLPWIAPVSKLYNTLCSRIRALFLESVQLEIRDKPDTASQTSRKSGVRPRRDTKTVVPERLESVLDVLHLYQADPQFAILGDSAGRLEQNASLMVAIAKYTNDYNSSLRDAASDCLTKLYAPDTIPQWGQPGAFMEPFWKISSQVLYTLAKKLLDEKSSESKSLLELLKRLLTQSNEFLRKHRDMATKGADIKERWHASVTLEVALLIILCSSDTSICTLATECFGLLCIEVQLAENLDEYQPSSTSIAQNMNCYVQLGNQANLVAGRKSQQRRIRQLLRTANVGSPGILAAWEEAWRRWKSMTPTILRPIEETREEASEHSKKSGGWQDKLRNAPGRSNPAPSINTISVRHEKTDEGRYTEWQNYAGFLAALGGVCFTVAQNDEFTNSQISSSGSSGYRSVMTDSSSLVEKFTTDMVELLACDHLMAREWIREIIGNDLSPTLYPITFHNLEETVSQCFSQDDKSEPICSPQYTLFVDQAVSVLKLIMERLSENTENLFLVDFSNLISLCAFYVNKLPKDSGSMKMKIKLCHLIEVMILKKDNITLRQEFKLRNKLLEIIAEWTSDYSLAKKPFMQPQYSNDHSQLEKLQKDLDITCLKTIVTLLHQLPLQPLESHQGPNSTQSKSKIFFKYFSYFFKILNRCRVLESESSSKSHNSIEFRTSSEMTPLKTFSILALSNLLSANVDAGLKYSFSMGYHEDTSTRAAFMEVLANILNQGTEFETLSETVVTDRYEKLIDVMVYSDLDIGLSLCKVCPSADTDDVSNVLLACYASRSRTMELLKEVIKREIENTENEADLFRRTSIATRLLSAYTKEHGGGYVKTVLLPVFQKIYERPREGRCFEMDPTKLEQSEDVKKNKNNVIEITEMFLQAICGSVDLAPQSFREICNHIATSVRERFPESKHTAVGSFIFLRFFCPAIVAPESDVLVKSSTSVPRDLRRGFLMATKVIQNLANNILFGSKETYMIGLNDFLSTNIYRVASFLREISKLPEHPKESAESHSVPYEMNEKNYAMLHYLLAENIENISKEVSARGLNNSHDREYLSKWKREFDRFANILAQLGRPPKISNKDTPSAKKIIYTNSSKFYTDFMKKNSQKNVDSLVSSNIIYEGGVSKAGRRIVYMIMRNIEVDKLDLELLIYHMVQTIETAATQPFEILIDYTLLTKNNEIPHQWLNQFMQLLSEHVYTNISTLYLYNPNTYLRTYLRKSPLQFLTQRLAKKTVFAATLAELQEFIPTSEIKLPEVTVSLERDPSAVFFPVYRQIQFRSQTTLTVKVNAEYIQVATVRKQEMPYGLQSIVNDVFHISEIDQIGSFQHDSSGSSSTNEFSFKTTRDASVYTFSSPKKDIIVNTIRQSKRRYEASRAAAITERTIRPKDVPGRLLNMSLLNLGSEDPGLRLSSYKLLYALSRAFNFDVGKQLLEAKDLCLPSNSTDFIVYISQKIAEKEPSLTLEFLNECVMGFSKSEDSGRYLTLLYMVPWLPNLSLYCENSTTDTAKTKEILKQLIDLTIDGQMTKLVQSKIWSAIAEVDDILGLVIETFIEVSNKHGVGSVQAEVLADTLVTLSSVSIRAKLASSLRKALYRTSFKPTRTLTEHETWPEIAILLRFVLMLSFNHQGPIKRIVPELFYIVSLVVGIGPTLVRASVHGIIINTIQSLCTRIPLSTDCVKKLQINLTELSDSKNRLLFGLNRTNSSAFDISPETLNDTVESISLTSLETIVSRLSDVLTIAAPNIDMANCWRARWMSLVASTAFQFNPAVQPRAFVILGHLGREEIDDDLLYQILVALRGALSIFSESDTGLVTSIIICLKNVVGNLPSHSVYLLQLFWVAVALVELNRPTIFSLAVELLEAVFRSLDNNGFFSGENSASEVLLAARFPIEDAANQLDRLCGVNFSSNFSIAIAGIIMKGLQHGDAKSLVYSCLCTFIDIERKQSYKNYSKEGDGVIDSKTLGYVAILLPIAVKNDSINELLELCGVIDFEIVGNGKTYEGIFDKIDIPDTTTALLFISLLSTMLNASDTEAERIFIYDLLSEAATSIPDVFALIYESLLPRMNQIATSSQSQHLIESVKSILITACSNPAFQNVKNRASQQDLLNQFGFSALYDSNIGSSSSNYPESARLASEIMEKIIS